MTPMASTIKWQVTWKFLGSCRKYSKALTLAEAIELLRDKNYPNQNLVPYPIWLDGPHRFQ